MAFVAKVDADGHELGVVNDVLHDTGFPRGCIVFANTKRLLIWTSNADEAEASRKCSLPPITTMLHDEKPQTTTGSFVMKNCDVMGQ